jgi:hypothetical protein
MRSTARAQRKSTTSYNAYTKAKAHDTAYYEGFFILKLAKPFKSAYNQVLTSSTDNIKMFGDKLLSKLGENSCTRSKKKLFKEIHL